MTGSSAVTVLLFAAAREAAGRGRLEIPHREGLTAAEVWESLESATPRWRRSPPRSALR